MALETDREVKCIYPNCRRPLVEKDSHEAFFICEGTDEFKHPPYLISIRTSVDGKVKPEKDHASSGGLEEGPIEASSGE
jgi:hypothetical protein